MKRSSGFWVRNLPACALGSLLSLALAVGCQPPRAGARGPGVDGQPPPIGVPQGLPPGSWLAIEASSDAPTPAQLKLDDAVVATFFGDDIPRASGGYTYAYGGKTANRVLASTTPGNQAVFATYFDNDYAGVNISFGSEYVDLRPYRKSGSLSFWIKGGFGARKFMIGLMDNQGGALKVQTKVSGDSYAALSEGEWTQCRIPLKAFLDDGVYWARWPRRSIGPKSRTLEYR